MGMIGNQLAAGQALTVANDSFNGDGSTTSFTLSQTVGSVHDIEVLVDNVQQSPYDGSYSVSGTTLTFSGTPSTGTNNIYVIYNASKHITTQQVIPDAGSVDHSKLHTNATLPITRDMTNNRVGINHTSPEQHLHVNSATNTRALIETTDAGSVAELQLKNTAQTVKLGIETSSDAGGGAYGGAGASAFAVVNGTNTGLVITTNGIATKPNLPAWGATRTGGHVAAGNYIIYNDANYNQGNHYSTTTGRFTAPVSGFYQVNVWHMSENNAVYDNKYFAVRINNTDFKRCYSSTSGTVNHHQFSWTGTLYLNASDHVSVYNNNLTIYATGASYSYFSGFLVG